MSKKYESVSYKLEVASRIVLAIVGGYALSVFSSLWIANFMPYPPRQSVVAANMLFFITYACAIIWSFSNIKTITAWIGICGSIAVFCALALFKVGV